MSTKPSNEIVLDRVQSSNMQPSEKTAVTRALAFLDQPASGLVPSGQAAGPVAFAMESLVTTITGGSLGLLHAELKDGLDWNGKPLDGYGALFLGVSSTVFKSRAGQEAAKTCLGIYAFRKTNDLFSLAKSLSKKPSDSVLEAGEGIP